MKQIFIGGARSGKSRLAQEYALKWQARTAGEVVVIATAEALNGEGSMAARIAHHQANRPADWLTVEASRDLAYVLAAEARPNRLLLVDCLTLWLANEMMAENWTAAKTDLLKMFAGLSCEIVFISNEVGQGVIPMGEFNRRFVDELGWLNQALASACDRTTVAIAGLPMVIREVSHD